jgi:hypothetical protein
MVALTIDSGQLKKLTRAVRHIQDGVPRALSPAINRALDHGRTVVKREIRKDYIIKAKDIPVRVRGANQARLTGEVRLQQGMLDLNKFKVTPPGVQKAKNKRVISAQVKLAGGGRLIPHGFVQRMGTGYVGPFVRKGPARLPLKKLVTIGAPIMASQPGVGPVVQKAMGIALAKNIDQQIVRFLATA